MLDVILIGMTDVDGTLVFRSDLRHSLIGIMCGQFNHEIVYHRLFVTSPFMSNLLGGPRQKCFVKQSNKDLPYFGFTGKNDKDSSYSDFMGQSDKASPYPVFMEQSDRASPYSVSTGQTVRDSP